MIKLLRNHWLLADGTAFYALRPVAESMVRNNDGWIRLHNWKGLLRISWQYKRVLLPAEQTYISVHNSYRGYYHWLLEGLPKLLEAKRNTAVFKLLLPASYTEQFYTDTLQLLGVADIERLQPNTMYKVPKLLLPYLEESMGFYSAERLTDLKATLLEATQEQQVPDSPKRLYISRRKALRRKVLNEEAVEQLVREFGFEIICFEDYSFAQQVVLCSNADAMVSIHGAGLSNILFLPTQAFVVEFRKFDDGENCFFSQLASTLHHRYHLLYCSAANEDQSVQDADLHVDLVELRGVLSNL